MKKLISLVALFLVWFGMTANAQKVTIIESIDENLKDIATLKTGDWVLLKNIQNGSGYLYEANNKLAFKGASITAGSSDFNQYLWQVTEETGGYSFKSMAGHYLPVMVVGKDAVPVEAAQKETFEVGHVSGNSNWFLKSLNAKPKGADASVYCKFQGGLQGGESTATPNGGNGRMNFQIFKAKVVETDLFEVAKMQWRKTQGYVGGYSAAEVETACNMATLDEAKSYIASCEKIKIDTKTYYRFEAPKRNVVMSVNAEGQQMVEKENSAAVNQLWQVVAEGTNYKLVNVNHAKYLAKPVKDNKGKWNVALAESDAAVVVTVTEIEDAQHSLKFDNGTGEPYVGAGGGASNFVVTVRDANKGGDACWYIKPVTQIEVNMNKAAADATESWASLYLPFGVKVAEGLEAYSGKVAGNKLQLTAVTEVPANSGVILKGSAEKYTLTIAEVAGTLADNELVGTNVALAKTANPLVLGDGEQGIGLYHVAADVAELKANKAYLEAAAGTNALKFVFGEATGVENVEVAVPADNVYYDLSGRRVANPVKGVYIHNGKKVYVK